MKTASSNIYMSREEETVLFESQTAASGWGNGLLDLCLFCRWNAWS